MLHTEGRDELLVHRLVTVLSQDTEEGLPLVQGLGGLPHATGETVGDESLLQNLLDGGVDVHGPGGGGGARNVISLKLQICC